MFKERKKLVYETSFYSELVGGRYTSIKGGAMERAINTLEGAFTHQEAMHNDFDCTPEGFSQEQLAKRKEDAMSFTQELFGTLVDGEAVTKTKKPQPWAKACFEALEANSEWRSLQRKCSRRKELSALVTTGLIEQLAGVLAKVRDQEKSNEGQGGQEGQGESKQNASITDKQMDEIDKAVGKQSVVAEQAESAYGSLAGTGMSEKQNSEADVVQKLKLVERLSRDRSLQSIMNLIGRIQAITKAKISKTKEKQVLLPDTEYGNDLRRLSQLEVANLAMPATETLFLKRYAERKLSIRKASGTSNVGRGDIILLLDERGSMKGVRSQISKAFTVATLQMAIKQKRKVSILGFSTGIDYHFLFEKQKCYMINGRGYKTPFASASAINHILTFTPVGGTSFGRAISGVIDNYFNRNKTRAIAKGADILMVTDANDRMPDYMVDELNDYKKRDGLRAMAVGILDHGNKEVLMLQHPWLDEAWVTNTDADMLIDNLTNMSKEAIK